MNRPISEKQEEYLRATDRRINLLWGSVRSGKTWISLLKWAIFVGSSPANYEFIMCSKTVTALKRNCLNLLVELVGPNNFKYSISQKTGTLFNHVVWLEGANDERSETKIRGMTLGGAYCDELTLFPQGFYEMLLSRLSMPGAKLFATTNPDSPMHWVKTDIIDNEQLDIAMWQFLLYDNIFLDPVWVEQIQLEYTGVFYQRYILGLWVKAEGLVYPMFDRDKYVVPANKLPLRSSDGRPAYEKYYISCDYGTMNPCTFILWGLRGGVWYAIDEYYYDGRKDTARTDAEHYEALKRLAGNRKIEQVIIDPSAASFITLIYKKGELRVKGADNSVIDGIRECGTALQRNIIKISDRCKHFISEFGLYAWNEDKQEDEVIKENDHCMDAFRYLVKTLRISQPKRRMAA